MLTSITTNQEPSRNLRHEKALWHDESRSALSLGCTACATRAICGGLQVSRPLFDCTGFCCQKPERCDSVCRNKPFEFAQRVREISGFDFANVPRASVLPAPSLPRLVPVLYHKNNRIAPFAGPAAVCFPLYRVIRRQNGQARYLSSDELAAGFTVARNIPVILTGTAQDAALERWWSLGPERREAIRALKLLGVALVTTPNFSLFVDQPRWDDLHSMKRIAIVHEEFLSEGMPAALHLNARTDKDWDRWRGHIAAREEITHVAFEFATGAGWKGRIDWQADQLMRFARAIERPLHLIVRGGNTVLPDLEKAFANVTLLDTTVFMKTSYRQKALLDTSGVITWDKSPTQSQESLDELLATNWSTVWSSYNRILHECVPPKSSFSAFSREAATEAA
jgi:hypothetical protein